jgi:hypothetical protein
VAYTGRIRLSGLATAGAALRQTGMARARPHRCVSARSDAPSGPAALASRWTQRQATALCTPTALTLHLEPRASNAIGALDDGETLSCARGGGGGGGGRGAVPRPWDPTGSRAAAGGFASPAHPAAQATVRRELTHMRYVSKQDAPLLLGPCPSPRGVADHGIRSSH